MFSQSKEHQVPAYHRLKNSKYLRLNLSGRNRRCSKHLLSSRNHSIISRDHSIMSNLKRKSRMYRNIKIPIRSDKMTTKKSTNST